jgi:hypothetical protein
MRMNGQQTSGWVLVGAILAGATGAQAQEPEPNPDSTATPEAAATQGPENPSVAQARDAFRLGSALAKQGQWNEALAAFERSESLRSHPITRFNIGYVERALGHLTRARKQFMAAARAGDSSALPPGLHQEAESYLTEIDHKLARVVASLEPDTAIAVDGRPLEPDATTAARPTLVAGTADPGAGAVPGQTRFDLFIDPGDHVIVLSRAGLADTVMNEHFAPGASRSLTLAMNVPTPEAPAPTPQPADSAPEADVGASTSSATPTILMWTAYGVGAAGIAVGSVFGVMAINKKSFLDGSDENGPRCPTADSCRDPFTDDVDTMKTDATVSTVGFGVGLLGAAVGTYFLLTSDSDDETAKRSSVTARAYVGPGSVRVAGTF